MREIIPPPRRDRNRGILATHERYNRVGEREGDPAKADPEAEQRVDTCKEPVPRNTRGLRGKRPSRTDINTGSCSPRPRGLHGALQYNIIGTSRALQYDSPAVRADMPDRLIVIRLCLI